MKSKEELRSEVSEFIRHRLTYAPKNWVGELKEWHACFDKVKQLKIQLNVDQATDWQLPSKDRWASEWPKGDELLKSWDTLWSNLSTEGVHGKDIAAAASQASVENMKEHFDVVKRENALTYEALIERAHQLGCFHAGKSPKTLEKWVINNSLSLLGKYLTTFGGNWGDGALFQNDEKRKTFTTLTGHKDHKPTLAAVFAAQLRREDKRMAALRFLNKHPLSTQKDAWMGWMLPLGGGRHGPSWPNAVKDRAMWLPALAQTQSMEEWRRVEILLERVLRQGRHVPLSKWQHMVEYEGLKHQFKAILPPEENPRMAL
jgi:hypothetical protein